jgi:hypothetical protein
VSYKLVVVAILKRGMPGATRMGCGAAGLVSTGAGGAAGVQPGKAADSNRDTKRTSNEMCRIERTNKVFI